MHRAIPRLLAVFGTAILLNFSSFSLPDLGTESVPPGVGKVFENLFTEAGVNSYLDVLDPAGAKARNLEVTRWHDGDIEILSLFQPYGKHCSMTVSLTTPRAVYDLRAGKCLGSGKRFKVDIVPARASFFALCPLRAARPKLTPEKPIVERGTLARCTVASPGAGGLHAFRLAVSAGGKEMDCFQKKVVADGAGTTVDLPVAFNDPAGTWKIQAFDILTGQSATTSLVVR